MEIDKLEESYQTRYPDALVEGLDERAFDVEIEKMYIDKLRQQRQKIECVSRHYQALRDELERKEQLLADRDRRIAAIGEAAVSKRKYEELMREFKVAEREREKAKS